MEYQYPAPKAAELEKRLGREPGNHELRLELAGELLNYEGCMPIALDHAAYVLSMDPENELAKGLLEHATHPRVRSDKLSYDFIIGDYLSTIRNIEILVGGRMPNFQTKYQFYTSSDPLFSNRIAYNPVEVPLSEETGFCRMYSRIYNALREILLEGVLTEDSRLNLLRVYSLPKYLIKFSEKKE